MAHRPPRRESRGHLEIESLPALHAALSSGRTLRGLRIQGLDLTAYEQRLLARTDVEGLVVLGGELPDRLDKHLREHHALIFPTDPHAPIDPYRSTLYQPHELYHGLREHGYDATPDARAYHWSLDGALERDAFVTLLRAIHDDSITDALTEFIGNAPVVGVMGGHTVPRGSEEYAAAARLGQQLASAGLLVATGGGPGAMEAANLGALAPSEEALREAMARLAAVPGFRPDIGHWAVAALDVYADLMHRPVAGQRVRSVGIPTWFYGHEPPNVFCNGIGKYFSNAIREDGLLSRCTAGLVVLKGAAGTVQETFQAATRLYYANDHVLPRLVLVGRQHWTEALPVWRTLRSLGAGRALGQAIHLVETVEEAAELCAPASAT